jgi:micrococcal nuclease
VLLGAVFVVGGCGTPSAAPTDPAGPGVARVVRTLDGDTLVVRLDGREVTVRVLGIDTPETKDPRRPVGCLGPEAAWATASLLPPGTAVRLGRDVEGRDRFDRLLAHVRRVADDRDLAAALLTAGLAEPLVVEPNTARRAELAALAATAARAQRGIWGACDPPDGFPG